MQFRLVAAMVVFLGSYLPLSVILFSQDIDYSAVRRNFCWPPQVGKCEIPVIEAGYVVSLLILTMTCFLITLVLLATVRPKQDILITEAVYVPTDLMNYTLPYVVSLMGIDFNEVGKFVGLSVFLSWMFWITYKSGQLIMNPVLIAVGWRLYDVKYSYAGSTNVHTGRALVKGYLQPGQFRRKLVQEIQLIKP